MTTNYDHITSQFSAALSDLAQRMYAVIYEMTSQAQEKTNVPAWELNEALDVDITTVGSPGEDALLELIKAHLVDPVAVGYRFRLTSAAWRAHLLAERAAHTALMELYKTAAEMRMLGYQFPLGLTVKLNAVRTALKGEKER